MLALASVLMLAVSAAGERQPDPFAACREQLARTPADYESSYCFYQAMADRNLWDEGARVFDALIAAHPENAWLPLAYGHVYRSRDWVRAERLYRRAAEAFKAFGHAEGELLARSNLRDLLFPLGRVDDAAREVARVVEIGNASTDPLLQARAHSLQALHIQSSGGDLGFAFRLLKQAENAVFPDGPYRLKRTTLNSLGLAALRLGRFDEALAIFHRLDALATAAGEAQTQAIAKYNAFNATAMQESVLPSPDGRERLLRLVRDALAAGAAARHPMVMVRSHSALAELLAHAPGSRAAALHHLRQCLALAKRAQQPYDEAVCSWIEADLTHSDAPARARAAAARALEATARANNARADAYSAGRHMRLSWSTKSRADAIRDSQHAIAAVERLRAMQDDATSSAGLFSAWTLDYYWLSGRLLQEGSSADLSLAFAVTERMRARALLDVLGHSRPQPDRRHPAVQQQRAARAALAVVQRALMNPALDDTRRRGALEELERLERREQEAGRQIAVAFPRRDRPAPAFATIETVQSALAPDEALLSFQVGLWETYDGDFGGGSWLMAVTRHQHTVHRLPDRVRLNNAVPVFTGLLEGGERHGAAAVRLYEELLADAIKALPEAVTRLVIVADGALHRLPFEALRAAPGSPPLGAHYHVVVAPSATLWLQWRRNAPREPARRVLILADPAVDAGVMTAAPTRNAALMEGLRLGRLPHARNESRAIQRHVGLSDALIGARASERAVKSRNLRHYGMLHLAAHAVGDEENPERAAVLLAPGDATEDGLLQAREIEALDLDGRIVVLSACYTAGGAVLSGEGVLSLARAFFAAGAHAVVATRWPVRDADAAALFDVFYRHLGRGVSLSHALTATQNEARASARPVSTWAALVLLGNGDLRPFAGEPSSAGSPPWAAPVLIVGTTLLVAIAVVLASRRSPVSRSRRTPLA